MLTWKHEAIAKMSPTTIFFGFLVAIALLLIQEACKKKKPQHRPTRTMRRHPSFVTHTQIPLGTLNYTPSNITPNPYSVHPTDTWRRRYPRRFLPWTTDIYRYRPTHHHRIIRPLGTAQDILNSSRKPRMLIEQWKRSIIGLTRLAHQNLNTAREFLKLKNYEGATKAASTSVENIARALIHCYGDKPNPTSGQEEPLKMIAHRLAGDEREEFNEAINSLPNLPHNHAVLKYLPLHNGTNNPNYYNAKQAEEAVQETQKIIKLFRRIMIKHFAIEIPEIQSIGYKSANM